MSIEITYTDHGTMPIQCGADVVEIRAAYRRAVQ
jgi:hypothetical protein